jgi:hypothetical protein
MQAFFGYSLNDTQNYLDFSSAALNRVLLLISGLFPNVGSYLIQGTGSFRVKRFMNDQFTSGGYKLTQKAS